MENDSPETIEMEVYGEPKLGETRFARGGAPAGAVVIEDISINQDEIIARVLARKHNKLSHSLRGGQ